MVGDLNMNTEFINIQPLRYWVQRVLPLVYDDSLSYMELLNKVVYKLNELIENNKLLPDYIADLIKEYISSGAIEKVLAEILADYMLNVKFPPEGLTPATGDGTADDTEAIQGCINYAKEHGGMAVYFPSGSYLTSSLTVYDKTTMFGYDRYNTRIILKGGATQPLLTGISNELTLTGLGFDGNMDIQVNNINLIDISVKSAIINNCLLTDGYELLKINVTQDLQIDNIIFDHAVVRGLDILGSGKVEARALLFNSLSNLLGSDYILLGTSNSILEDIHFNGTSPIGIQINGDNNIVKFFNGGVVSAYTDNGINNSIEVYTESKVDKVTGNVTVGIGGSYAETVSKSKVENIIGDKELRTDNYNENINGNKIISITGNLNSTVYDNLSVTGMKSILIDSTAEMELSSGDNIFLNPTNLLKYGELMEVNEYFKGLPMLDKNNNPYFLLSNLNADKLSSIFIDVSKYGVVPNSSNDQTELIQNLLNTYTYLFFPEGNYNISSLNITGYKYIYAPLAILKSVSNNMLTLNNFNGVIDTLSLSNSSTELYYNAINMLNCNGSTLQNITINPSPYIGINLNSSQSILIEKCIIKEWKRVGIYSDGARNILIDNCFLSGKTGVSLSHAVQYNRGKNNTIRNSYLENGGEFNISLVSERFDTISNNTCKNSIAEAINLEGGNTCSVNNNRCSWDIGVSTDFGISIYGPESSKQSNFNIINGNIIDNPGKAGIALADLCLFNNITNNSINNGNLKEVTDVDGAIVAYIQNGTIGAGNNLIANNLITGDKFNYLFKETTGYNNACLNNYMLNFKPTSIISRSTLVRNPQLTWNNFTPNLRVTDGEIGQYEWVISEYALDGQLCRINLLLHIITNNTASGAIYINLPFSANRVLGSNNCITAYNQSTGNSAYIGVDQTEIYLRRFDGQYIGGDESRIYINGYYNLNT